MLSRSERLSRAELCLRVPAPLCVCLCVPLCASVCVPLCVPVCVCVSHEASSWCPPAHAPQAATPTHEQLHLQIIINTHARAPAHVRKQPHPQTSSGTRTQGATPAHEPLKVGQQLHGLQEAQARVWVVTEERYDSLPLLHLLHICQGPAGGMSVCKDWGGLVKKEA